MSIASQVGDAAALDGARARHADAEGDLRQDGQLVGGVGAVDVERRVGLGVAALLGLGQGVGVAPAAARSCR